MAHGLGVTARISGVVIALNEAPSCTTRWARCCRGATRSSSWTSTARTRRPPSPSGWAPPSTSTIAPAASPTRHAASRSARPAATGSSSSMPTRWCHRRWPATCAPGRSPTRRSTSCSCPAPTSSWAAGCATATTGPARHARFFRPGSLLMTDRIHKSIEPAPGTPQAQAGGRPGPRHLALPGRQPVRPRAQGRPLHGHRGAPGLRTRPAHPRPGRPAARRGASTSGGSTSAAAAIATARWAWPWR